MRKMDRLPFNWKVLAVYVTMVLLAVAWVYACILAGNYAAS